MKKRFVFLATALLVTALMISGAWASQLDIAAAGAVDVDVDVDAAATGAYVVGSEWLAGQAGVVTVDLASAIATPGGAPALRSNILYKPTIDLGVNSTFIVTVTNGAIAPNTAYGLWRIAGGAAGLVGDMVDFVADANGNYTSMTFKIVAATAVDAVLAFTEDSLVPGAANRPTLKFTAAQLAAGNMTLQVTAAYDDTSLPLVAPLTAAEVVAKRAAQLSAVVQHQVGGADTTGNATSVIDVEATPARAEFVPEVGGDTTATTSTAALLVNSATVNNGVDLTAAAYTVTVTGATNAAAITGVALQGTALTAGTGVWTLTSDFATHDLTNNADNDLVITVDGATVLNPATYTVTLLLDPAEVGVASQTALNDETAFVWTINGWQGTVPYHFSSATQAEDTFIKIFNNSSVSGEVTVDVTTDAGTTATNVSIGTVAAGTVGIFWAHDIAVAAGIADGAFAGVYTVNAPQNSITAVANQKRPGGVDRVIPVYTGDAGYKNY